MRENIRACVQAVAETLTIPQPVIELGSFQVEGQAHIADLRPLFADSDYTGCDMRPGPGVDRIEDVHQLSFATAAVGTVLMLETLEHVKNPLQALAEVWRVLRPGGLVVISSVMDFPVHEFPADYWRFAPQGFDLLLERFSPRRVYIQGLPLFPHSLVGVGIKPGPAERPEGHARPAELDRLDQRMRTLSGAVTQEISPRLGPDPFRLLGEELRAEEQARYPVNALHVAHDQLLQKDEEIARLQQELKRVQPACTAREKTTARFDYADYEFRLRDRQWNREMQSGYVAHFQGCHKVLDLACGSGIFLELLAERGIPALGVERNPTVVAWVKQHGWDIVEQDVFAFLEQTTETYDGVFCSHFLEHLPFEQVLRFFELLAPRVSVAGTVVIVVPNPESVRMQLLGFWRDPEHVRFYHPELLEAVCQHAGLEVIHTNREDAPHLLSPLALPPAAAAGRDQPPRPRGWLKERLRTVYFQFLRRLRLAPAADLLALEARLRQHRDAQQKAMTAWAEGATDALNSMWSRPDNAAIVCRKTAA